jgi:hypothetical protein
VIVGGKTDANEAHGDPGRARLLQRNGRVRENAAAANLLAEGRLAVRAVHVDQSFCMSRMR